jgi:WD40 repeat protein
VRVIDPATGTELTRLPAPPTGPTIDRLAVTHDGTILVGTSDLGTLAAWDLPSGALRWALGPPEELGPNFIDESCDSLALDRSGRVMFCGDGAGVVREIDLADGLPTGRRFDFQHGWVADLFLTADGTALVEVGGERPVLGRWQLDAAGPITRLVAPERVPLGYSSDGAHLLVKLAEVDGAGAMDVWDPVADAEVDPLDDMIGGLWSGRPDRVIGGFSDGIATAYDITTHERICPCRPLVGTPTVTVADVADALLFVVYDHGEQRLMHGPGEERPLDIPQGDISDAAFSADGDRLAIAYEDGMRLVDTRTGEVILETTQGGFALLDGGNGRIVRAEPSGQVSFLDDRTLEPIGAAFRAVVGRIEDVAMSRDGQLVMIRGADRTVRLFDAASGTPLGDPIALPGPVVGASLRGDGLELAAQAATGVGLWDLDPEHWRAAACRVAGRNLTRAEWDTYIGDLADYRATCPQYE